MFADNPKFDGKDRAISVPPNRVPRGPGYENMAFGILPLSKSIKRRDMFYIENFMKQWPGEQELLVLDAFVHTMTAHFQLDPKEVNLVLERTAATMKERCSILGAEHQFEEYMEEHQAALDEAYNRRFKSTEKITTTGMIFYGFFGPTNDKGENPEFRNYWNTIISHEHKRCEPIVVLTPNNELADWKGLDPRNGHIGKKQYYHEEQLQMLMHQREANARLKKQDLEDRKKRDTTRVFNEKKEKAQELGIKRYEQHMDADGNLTNPLGKAARAAQEWAETDDGKRTTAVMEAKLSELTIDISDETRRQLGTDTGALRDAVERAAGRAP